VEYKVSENHYSSGINPAYQRKNRIRGCLRIRCLHNIEFWFWFWLFMDSRLIWRRRRSAALWPMMEQTVFTSLGSIRYKSIWNKSAYLSQMSQQRPD